MAAALTPKIKPRATLDRAIAKKQKKFLPSRNEPNKLVLRSLPDAIFRLSSPLTVSRRDSRVPTPTSNGMSDDGYLLANQKCASRYHYFIPYYFGELRAATFTFNESGILLILNATRKTDLN